MVCIFHTPHHNTALPITNQQGEIRRARGNRHSMPCNSHCLYPYSSREIAQQCLFFDIQTIKGDTDELKYTKIMGHAWHYIGLC